VKQFAASGDIARIRELNRARFFPAGLLRLHPCCCAVHTRFPTAVLIRSSAGFRLRS
jgi:hypothetical protein